MKKEISRVSPAKNNESVPQSENTAVRQDPAKASLIAQGRNLDDSLLRVKSNFL
jgi:hypothetical protein